MSVAPLLLFIHKFVSCAVAFTRKFLHSTVSYSFDSHSDDLSLLSSLMSPCVQFFKAQPVSQPSQVASAISQSADDDVDLE